MPEQVPIGWRGEWTPTLAKRFEGTPVNCVVNGSKILYPAPAPLTRAPLEKVRWDAPAPIVIEGAPWPSVKTGRDGNEGGPTGAAWIDSNGWIAQLALAMAPGKAVWIAPQPPEAGTIVPPQSYGRAVADSASYGASPLIAFDEDTSKGEPWNHFLAALRFFEAHREWRSFNTYARLGIVSDFSGGSQFLSGEMLNLSSRRNLLYRVLPKALVTTARLAGLTTVIYLDDQPPASAVAFALTAFGRKGLLLASPKTVAAFGGAAKTTREWDDPWLIAAETQLMMSHRQDLHRLYNAASAMTHYTVSPDGRKGLVQLINYAGRDGASAITLWLEKPWREVRFWTLGSDKPARLEPVAANRGIDLQLPPIGVYSAIELGG